MTTRAMLLLNLQRAAELVLKKRAALKIAHENEEAASRADRDYPGYNAAVRRAIWEFMDCQSDCKMAEAKLVVWSLAYAASLQPVEQSRMQQMQEEGTRA